jgi:hypothetical protein
VRIGRVDIPEALIEAQREGELVIFVGAGASRSSPSDLPDFVTLANRIAADSGVTPTDATGISLDQPFQFLPHPCRA